MRHNDLRDFTANLLTEVCPNVCIEPPLQALTGELLSHDTSNSEDGARLDVSAHNFWSDRHHRAFFDVRVFHPNAPSIGKCSYHQHTAFTNTKSMQRSYDQRVLEVEHGSFTPLVFSTSGGMHGEMCFRNIQETCLSSIYQARATLRRNYCLDKMLS